MYILLHLKKKKECTIIDIIISLLMDIYTFSSVLLYYK